MKKTTKREVSIGKVKAQRVSKRPALRGVGSSDLTKSESHFASFMNQLPRFAWIKDLEGRYVYANSAVQKLAPYREGWLGKTDVEIWPKEIADTYWTNDQQVIAECRPLETLEPYTVAGRRHFVMVSRFPILNDSGAVILVGGAGVDVTVQADAERLLREYEKVVEGLEEMIGVVDRDYRYLLANRAFLDQRGAKRQEVVGRFVWEVDGREAFFQVVKGKLDECFAGHVVNYESKAEHPEKGQRVLSLSYLPIQGAQAIDRVACILRDITQQKTTGIALREAERKYREIFENAGEGIFQSTPEGRYIAANPALAAMYGFDNPEELIRDCNDISKQIYVDPSRRDEFIRLIGTQGMVRGFEIDVFRKDRTRFWVMVNARVVRDSSGQILYFEGTTQDITERKRAESKSIAFAALARKLSGARTQLDAARIIAQTAQDLFGWDACTLDLYSAKSDSVFPLLNVDTINGRQITLASSILSRPPTMRSRRILEHGPEIILREKPIQFDSGSVPFGDQGRPTASIMGVPIKHGDEIVGLFSIQSYGVNAYDQGTLKDLVALAEHCGEAINRIRVEESFRESEARYRELFENSRDAIYVHDLAGRYTSVNRASEELSGFSRAEILGKHYSNFLAPGSLKEVRENLYRKLDARIETIYEAEVICKDGTRKPVEVSSRMICKDGAPIAVQGTARDIGERKRAQEILQTYSRRLIEAQETERQNISRELHDQIGQILTAVRLNLQSVQKSCETDVSLPRIRESIQVIDEALTRVRELSLELRPSVLDDLGLTAALRWYAARYMRRSGIATEVGGDVEFGRIPREIETACFRISQEALTNTARHSRAKKVIVHVEKRNGHLHLTICDNGQGFDSNLLLNGRGSSLALGLRGMQERALAVNGHFEINSTLGKGTQVIVQVPLEA